MVFLVPAVSPVLSTPRNRRVSFSQFQPHFCTGPAFWFWSTQNQRWVFANPLSEKGASEKCLKPLKLFQTSYIRLFPFALK
jgi:hypothetical protein